MPLWGKACTEVALAVGVARQTVYTWKRLRHEGGIDALRAVPDPGRPAQLDQAQLAALQDHVGGLDFADALHLRASAACEALASFDDRKFARRAKRLKLHPPVTVPA